MRPVTGNCFHSRSSVDAKSCRRWTGWPPQRASPSQNHLLWNRQGYSPMTPSVEHLPTDEIGYGILNISGACLEPIHRVRLCAEEEVHFTCVMFKTRTVKKPFSLGSGREVGEFAPLLVFSPDVCVGGRSLIYGEDITRTHTHQTVKRHARSQPWDHEKDILVATPLFN